ncbi:MAG: hypothetical protein OXL37_17710, partial [Chloroflexota bacterium]|nr:hypothetical protein [Chloroflexota bacterium]
LLVHKYGGGLRYKFPLKNSGARKWAAPFFVGMVGPLLGINQSLQTHATDAGLLHAEDGSQRGIW